MRKFLILLLLFFAAAALAQAIDMAKFPAPAAGEFGPRAEVMDTLSIAENVAVDGQTHTDGEGAADEVGAFRFICTPGQVNGDDHLIAFGVKGGAPHIHQWYGNEAGNFGSTYSTLRTTGASSCVNALNRTAYYVPALISGGKVRKFDYAQIYYKRFPKNSKYCNPNDPAFVGECVGIPNDLHMIFGYDPVTGTAPTGSRRFSCVSPTYVNRGPFEADMVSAVTKCQDGDWLDVFISAPNCWNGRDLDSPNHRDHVAYTVGNGSHTDKCPASHPKLIPHFEAQTFYKVDGNLDRSGNYTPQTATWRFSCEVGSQTLRPGNCFHQDYAEGWNGRTKKAWTDNCIDRMLSCSGGQLGNGYYLKPSQPNAPPAVRDVPMPLLRGGSATFSGHVGHTM